MLSEFPRPVSVLVGLGMPRNIRRLRDALTFLDEQPTPLRDEAYEATLSTCRGAASGKASLEDAHDVFSAFARRHGILVEELPARRPASRLSA